MKEKPDNKISPKTREAFLTAYLAQLWESLHTNRTELFKHLITISIAGLGFNLVQTVNINWAWFISTISFFLTIVFCLIIFYLISRRAETAIYRYNPDAPAEKDEERLNRELWLTACLSWLSVAVFFIFTVAMLCAILVQKSKIALLFDGG